MKAHDLAALTLRATLGPMLFAHGWNKVNGPGGIEGTTGWFEALGLKPAAVHARMAAGTEMAAGLGLTLGAAGPLPAAATVGLMTVAARTDHRGKGFFVFKGGWEYVGVVGGAAVALAALGNGRYSIDGLLGRQRAGAGPALLAAAVGTASAAGLLAVCYRPDEPEQKPDDPERTPDDPDKNQ
ncbi:DoxX family protein [Streptomyces spinoverrucosus]|uniref:DoxX family protein n=1 Tax=Streptomyces spinoverrucosus TaxID=284043 RepID=UPI0018C3919B|nr:DoxX family protein [Streptomyces spinoverrucosus]MBG0857155.1 DoxX family protein [Streptomyces spinoverrucosus]